MCAYDGMLQENIFRPKKIKTKKVFVVTSGTYSDYQIDAIFSTKKGAEKYIAGAKQIDVWHSGTRVEEYELDEYVNAVPRLAYFERVDIRDLEKGAQFDMYGRSEKILARPNIRSKDISDEYCDGVFAFQSFVSQKHAHDLCVKRIQKLSAENLMRRGEI